MKLRKINTKSKYLTILLVVPFMMASSQAPTPTVETYGNLSVSYSLIEKKDNNYIYDVTIDNIGDKYSEPQFVIYKDGQDYAYVHYSNFNSEIFNSFIIAPKTSSSYVVSIKDSEIPYIENYSVRSFAYSIVDLDVSFSNIIINDTNSTKSPYYYSLNTSISGLSDHIYGALIHITYNEKEYCISSSIFGEDSDGKLYFSTREKLDLSKFSVDKIVSVRSEYSPKRAAEEYKKIYTLIITLALTTLFVVLPGIVAAIVVPLAVKKHKRRNNKK